MWEQCTVKGEAPVVCAGETFTPHHDKVKEVYFTGVGLKARFKRVFCLFVSFFY